MKKKIAVYIGEVGGTFQQTIIKVISAKARKFGYDVMVFCSFGIYSFDMLYAEGERACIQLPDPSVFDGIIVTEDLFDNPGMGDELYEKLKIEAKCPVVYLRTAREGFHGILLENYTSMKNMVNHFIEDHGFNDICYMSGKAGNYDALERLRAFMDVMKEKNIPVTENMIFHGDFWRDKGEDAVNWFMKDRDSYPQVIIAANDYMAISVCDALRKRGVRVPEDVCVSGFDYAEEAKNYEPRITSLEVDFAGMADRAMSIIENVNNGIHEDLVQYMPAKLILNKSCGCGRHYDMGDIRPVLSSDYYKVASMKSNMLMSVEYQDCFDVDECMVTAERFRDAIKADRIFFCLSDINEQGFDDVENDSSFTEQMLLVKVLGENVDNYDSHILFPRKELLPREFYNENDVNVFFFFTIHYKNKVHGYMVTEMPKREWFDIYSHAYIVSLANAIESCYVHRRMEKLEEIKALYQKDPLTGLYNRRGFDKILREKTMSNQRTKVNYGIVSIDMDNLKVINDNYGHSVGDVALKALADILLSVVDEGEAAARMGGDEFSAIININDANSVSLFRERLQKGIDEYNAGAIECKLSASIGICELFENDRATLFDCMNIADMRMYEDKRSRKARENTAANTNNIVQFPRNASTV